MASTLQIIAFKEALLPGLQTALEHSGVRAEEVNLVVTVVTDHGGLLPMEFTYEELRTT